jgi:hypothetical protein
VETGQGGRTRVLEEEVIGHKPVPHFDKVDRAAARLGVPDLEAYHAARVARELGDGLIEVSSAEGVKVCDFD